MVVGTGLSPDMGQAANRYDSSVFPSAAKRSDVTWLQRIQPNRSSPLHSSGVRQARASLAQSYSPSPKEGDEPDLEELDLEALCYIQDG